ncbi:MAG: hypothetical protein ACFFCT_14725, partial [Candidatus Odinarchaeota archaeon]
ELMEEISSYLDFRKQLNEAIESGTDEESAIESIADDLGIDQELASRWAKYEDLPEELRDLMARETQWRWNQKYRSIMETVYPTSMDEFEDLSDTERRLVQAWFEIRELQEEDEIQFIVRKGKPFYNLDQVKELSFKYGIHERETLAWLKGRALPAAVRNNISQRIANLERIGFFEPYENVVDLRTQGEIQETLLNEFPGLRFQKHIEGIIRDLNSHVNLIANLERYENITKEDLKKVASELSIPMKKAVKWALLGQKPVAYSRLDDAKRSRELGQKLLGLLGPYTSSKLVKQVLEESNLVSLIDRWKNAAIHWDHLEKYYQYLKLLLDGTLRKDIIRLLGISPSTSDSWSIGHLPYPIRLIVKPESARSEMISTEHELKNLPSNIIDIEELIVFIRKNYPGLLQIQGIEELIEEATLFLRLAKNLSKIRTIRASELREYAKSIGIQYSTARRWVLEGRTPELYHLLNQAKANRKTVEQLRKILPFQSIEELESALKTFYLSSHLSRWLNYENLVDYYKSYLQFLELFERGYNQEYIANTLTRGTRTVYEWTRETLPLIPYMLQRIPREGLDNDWYWLPLYIEGRMFSGFIQVPKKVTSVNDLQKVMKQFQDSTMTDEDFLYLLGVLASDGYIAKRSKTSYSLRVLLSKKYKWSKRILQTGKDVLAALGLDSSITDYVRERDEVSELRGFTSPFFIWIREAVIGLKEDEIKSYDDMRANWILTLPENQRLAFLQGFADGDGFASFFSNEVAIGSLSNKKLLHELLASFGISTQIKEYKVTTCKSDGIIAASKLPLFRHAKFRAKVLRELAEYWIERKKQRRRKIPEEEIEFARTLQRDGMSIGRIVYAIWKKNGSAIAPTSLSKALERKRGTHKSGP